MTCHPRGNRIDKPYPQRLPTFHSASEENTVEQPDAATDASDGLADREAAERFHQAVEHRLSEPTPAEPGSEEPAPGG